MAMKFRTVLVAFAVLGVGALLATAAAQPFGPGPGFWGPGMMSGRGIGPWMMGRRSFVGICNLAATGFDEWRADWIEQLVKPTDTQRAKFDEFKSASIKSAEGMRDACQTKIPDTIVGRTEAMEKRIDSMLQAVQTIRPALEAFYATLTDEQKRQLDSSSGPGRFSRWRDRW